MKFVQTHYSRKFGNYELVLSEYDKDGLGVYVVSIEFTFNNGLFTSTLDLFEVMDFFSAEKFYLDLTDKIFYANRKYEGD